jgi:hypothetical protein
VAAGVRAAVVTQLVRRLQEMGGAVAVAELAA